MDDLDELEDFESEEFGDEDEGDDKNAFVSDLWDRYGFTRTRTQADKAEALLLAHKMVSQFVSIFAGGEQYRVTFDPGFTTAGTDLVGRSIVITPGPVFDPRLTPREAGLILTAMASHEACHPRYGRTTAEAVVRVFGRKRAPNNLSNLLDDVRIERRFADDYPGYAQVFRPMLEYIGRDYRKKGVRPKLTDMVNLATLGLRYESCVDWPTPDVVEQREWFKSWVDRWVKEDAPRRHVIAIREALQHVAEVKALLKTMEVKENKPRPEAPPEAESVTRLKATLAGMTPLQRNAVRMFSQGRTGPEIAATLGLRLDDAKVLIRSVRTQLAASARGVDIRAQAASGLGIAP